MLQDLGSWHQWDDKKDDHSHVQYSRLLLEDQEYDQDFYFTNKGLL